MKDYWKKCNICKKEIPFGSAYFLCSVSTCRNSRTGFTFCSLECWDAHLGFVKHRSCFAEEAIAPRGDDFLTKESSDENTMIEERPSRRIICSHQPTSVQHNVDTLVVVSKVKQFIKDESELNTSQCAIDALTQKVVQACLDGIVRAKEAGRKTLMGRDILV